MFPMAIAKLHIHLDLLIPMGIAYIIHCHLIYMGILTFPRPAVLNISTITSINHLPR